MLRLLQTFIEIAVWRKGPQDLPASNALLTVTLACYVGLSFLQGRIVGHSFSDTVLLIAIDVAMICVWLVGVLSLFAFRSRFAQTLTAMLGVGILLSILDMAIGAAAESFGDADTLKQIAFPYLLVILLALGRIFMVALERGLLTGMALAYAMVMSTMALANLIVDPIVPTVQ